MIEIRAFGTLEILHGDGRTAAGVMTQPKRAALLVYLVLARPPGFHRRDHILAMFWPELDDRRARRALNQALTFLRRELGHTVIITRGQEEVGIESGAIRCDVVAFEEAMNQGRAEAALANYRAELLKGLHVSGAPDFTQWVDQERSRLQRLAVQAACGVAAESRGNGEMPTAIGVIRRAHGWDPMDETALRLLLVLEDEAGNRANALAEYEAFSAMLQAEFDIEPAPETRDLVESIRRRFLPSNDPLIAPSKALELHGGGTNGFGTRPRAWIRPSKPGQAVWLAASVLLAIIGGSLAVAWRNTNGLISNRVVVAPIQNQTGDTTLAMVGQLAAHWITDGLQRSTTLEVVPTSTAVEAWRYATLEVTSGRVRDPIRVMATETRARIVVWGSFIRAGDSIAFHAQISDAEAGRLLAPSISTVAATVATRQSVDLLRQKVLGSLAATLGQDSMPLAVAVTKPPTYEAYAAFVNGMERHDRQEWGASVGHFYRAAALDTTFMIPLIVSGLVQVAMGQYAQADSVAEVVGIREGRLNPVESHNLDHLRALVRGDWHNVYQSATALYRLGAERFALNAGIAAFRLNRAETGIDWLERLDPQRGAMRAFAPYWVALTQMHHALGQHGEELEAVKRARKQFPTRGSILRLEMRVRAAKGDYAAVLRLLEESQSMSQQGGTYLSLAEMGGLELSAHGYPSYGQKLLRHALAGYAERGRSSRSFGDEFDVARIMYHTNQLSLARSHLEVLTQQHPENIEYMGYLGMTVARLGGRNSAVRISAKLEQVDRPFMFGSNTLWRARIAAALSDDTAALQLLETAIEEGAVPAPVFTLHTDGVFQRLRDHAAFRQLVQPRS